MSGRAFAVGALQGVIDGDTTLDFDDIQNNMHFAMLASSTDRDCFVFDSRFKANTMES